jgi:hypothetical protein
MQRSVLFVLFLLVFLTGCSSSRPGGVQEHAESKWSLIQKNFASHHLDPRHTLIILDDDDSILENTNYIGSPPWFAAEKKAISNGKGIVTSMSDFYALNNFVLSLSPMKLCESSEKTIISNWQKRGFTVMVVTARTPLVRFSTQRELINNGINITGYPCLKSQCVHGLGRVLFLGANKKHAYTQGFLFDTGANKATALQQLFAAAPPAGSFTNYVVVDDTQKNLTDFRQWYKQQTKVKSLYLYHYTKRPTFEKPADVHAVDKGIVALYKEFGSPERVY